MEFKQEAQRLRENAEGMRALRRELGESSQVHVVECEGFYIAFRDDGPKAGGALWADRMGKAHAERMAAMTTNGNGAKGVARRLVDVLDHEINQTEKLADMMDAHAAKQA